VNEHEGLHLISLSLMQETPETSASASTSSVWQQTKFTDDSDGRMSAKFKRLMGMKEGLAGY